MSLPPIGEHEWKTTGRSDWRVKWHTRTGETVEIGEAKANSDNEVKQRMANGEDYLAIGERRNGEEYNQ